MLIEDRRDYGRLVDERHDRLQTIGRETGREWDEQQTIAAQDNAETDRELMGYVG